MPPFFTKEDFCQLLQKVTVLELKIHRLEEMNALEDSTCVQMGEKAVRRDQRDEEMEAVSESQAVWNSFSARPKNLSGRIQLLDHDEWPELQRNDFSPLARRRKQRQAGIKTPDNSQRHEDRAVFLQNRFTPLEVTESEQSSFSDIREGPEIRSSSKPKQVQRETFKNQEMLIITDKMVNELRGFWNKKKVKVLSFADKISDLTENILQITAEYPALKMLIIHTGSDEVMNRQSEILKKDFIQLLNAVQNLNMDVFLSGPVPTARAGAEKFSRLFALNGFLEKFCAEHSVRFVDNFDLFWERRHLFKSDGLTLNRSGAELLASNMKYFLNQVPAGTKQESDQLTSEAEGQREQTETLMENKQVADKETATEPEPEPQREELLQAADPKKQLVSSASQTEEPENVFPQPTGEQLTTPSSPPEEPKPSTKNENVKPISKKKVYRVGDRFEDPVKREQERSDYRTKLLNLWTKNKDKWTEKKKKEWKESIMSLNPDDEYFYVWED